MTKRTRCPTCWSKVTYGTWAHAEHDAKKMNHKQRGVGRMEPYRGPCGRIHVGRTTPPEKLKKPKKPIRKRSAWNWRKALEG